MKLTPPVSALAASLAFARTVGAQAVPASSPPAPPPESIDVVALPPPTALPPVRVRAVWNEPVVANWSAYGGRVVRPQLPRRRAEYDIAVDYIRNVGSAYNDIVSLWGYDGFANFLHISTRALAVVVRDRGLLLGGRVGYLHANGGRAFADGQSLDANLADVGVVARIRHEWIGESGQVGRVGFDLEVGPAFGTIELRERSPGFASVRLGGTFFIGVSMSPKAPSFVFRIGGQYLPFGGAGMGAGDPVFAGLMFGAAIEVPQ